MKSFIIGVGGASSSGKSTVSSQIISAVGQENVTAFMLDNYYFDRSHLSMAEREKINFDHPDALDWPLIIKHFNQLADGLVVETPQYDFTTHTRTKTVLHIIPTKVIIIEGIFALFDDQICKKMGLKIFVDTAPDICLMRRLKRDIINRHRSLESVLNQYSKFVRPMYKKFVEPTKRQAHIIIPHGSNKGALEMIISRINTVLNGDKIILDNGMFFEEE